ncbi:MAG: hypothetical protein Q8M94_08010 [Ignavibacteria bacterium]|nr:hypothetical protein [Ignavibacteria bacterium]
MKLYCEKCPVSPYCKGYKKAEEANADSYHPQEVVRSYYWDCPLVKLIEPIELKEE